MGKAEGFSGMGLALIFCAGPAAAADLVLPVGGRVTVELLRADAAARNTLSLVSARAGVDASGCDVLAVQGAGLPLLTASRPTAASDRGCRVVLDADSSRAGIQPFPVGSTLRFNLDVCSPAEPACAFRWSSDPASNPDGAEHLRTTPIPGTSPGRAFRLEWEDQPGLGDGDFDDLVVAVRVDGDRDGDGLWDDWERRGVDVDGDGIVDLRLPGASPDRKDLFVELDWMDCSVPGGDCDPGDRHGHAPDAEALERVRQAFARAPVPNPDGSSGIRLHLSLGRIVHRRFLDLGCFGARSFEALKADRAHFGLENPRRFTHRYVVFGHAQAPGDRGSSGCGERPGDDSLVTLAAWSAVRDDSIRLDSGALLHELGHNLGLEHGGHDTLDGKPNYLSVMNHAYEFTGLPPDGRLDFSRAAAAPLDEETLLEGTATGALAYVCPDLTGRTARPGFLVDWDCDGEEDATPATLDVNGDRFCVRPAAGRPLAARPAGDDVLIDVPIGPRGEIETWIADGPNRLCETPPVGSDERLRAADAPRQPRLLEGSSDWNRLVYAFQASQAYRPGREVRPPEEITGIPDRLPDLAMVRFETVPSGSVPAGSTLTYAATIANKGHATAVGVAFEQEVPPETRFRSCELTLPSGSVLPCALTSGTVRAELDELGSTASDRVTLTLRVDVPPSSRAGTEIRSVVETRIAVDDDCTFEYGCDGSVGVEPNRAEVSVTVSAASPDCPPGYQVILGTPGSDVLEGTSGNDCLVGGEGDDVLVGGPGDDVLLGGDGDDQLDGGDGDDVLRGGPGNDQLNGGWGADLLDGGEGADACLVGESPGDRLVACNP